MPVRSLNHAVLFVADVPRSVGFYTEVLGFERIAEFPGGAFLRGGESANDHDLGLFQASAPARPAPGAVGLYHLAWEVATLREFAQLRDRLAAAGSLSGASNHAATKALYARDPDGLEFEITWLVPDHLVEEELHPGVVPTRPLDLDAEIARYGADTPGGPRADRALYARIAARLG